MTPLLLASSLPFWTCRRLQPPPLARNPAGLAAAKREAAWPDAARPLKPGRVHRKRQPPELRPVEIRLDAVVASTFQSLSCSPDGDRSRPAAPFAETIEPLIRGHAIRPQGCGTCKAWNSPDRPVCWLLLLFLVANSIATWTTGSSWNFALRRRQRFQLVLQLGMILDNPN